METEIRTEARADIEAVFEVNRLAFGSEGEAKLVDALRHGGYVATSLVAVADGQVVGHILFSRITIQTQQEAIDALSLAPMAVLPEFQRQGIGSQLVRAGLDELRNRSEGIVIVLGHPEYYPQFGFSAERAEHLESPFGGGDAWMALELKPAALRGIAGRVEYSPPFMELS